MEIVLNNVCYSINKVNYKKKSILENLSIKFSAGLIHGIVGKSGSGKTILIELLAGKREITSGEIKLSFANNEVGFLTEEDNDKRNILVIDKIKEEIYLYKNMNHLEFNKRIIDSLKMVNLNESYLYKNWVSLSSGEKKKILIAIMLFHNPKLLLLDDPFRGIDSKGKNELCKFLKMLKNRYNKTIVITSNDVDSLHKIVDKVYILNGGNICLSGDKYQVFSNVSKLKKYGVAVPRCILFSNTVLKRKNIKIGYRDDINDLLKDIYRYAKW